MVFIKSFIISMLATWYVFCNIINQVQKEGTMSQVFIMHHKKKEIIMKTQTFKRTLMFAAVFVMAVINSAYALDLLFVSSTENCFGPEEAGYTAPADNLSVINFGDFEITEARLSSGDPVHLKVGECYDGELGIEVPWSEASSAMDVATINFFNGPCDGRLPGKVEITLVHGFSCILTAYDGHGVVDIATAAPNSPAPQTLTLTSKTGIERIEIDGAEICILEICLECDEEGEPDPNPNPNPDPEPHPQDCPPEIIESARQEGFDEGYMAGLAAASLNNGNEDSCATVNEKFDIMIPCVDVAGQMFPVQLHFTGNIFTGAFTWSLMP